MIDVTEEEEEEDVDGADAVRMTPLQKRMDAAMRKDTALPASAASSEGGAVIQSFAVSIGLAASGFVVGLLTAWLDQAVMEAILMAFVFAGLKGLRGGLGWLFEKTTAAPRMRTFVLFAVDIGLYTTLSATVTLILGRAQVILAAWPAGTALLLAMLLCVGGNILACTAQAIGVFGVRP